MLVFQHPVKFQLKRADIIKRQPSQNSVVDGDAADIHEHASCIAPVFAVSMKF